MIWLIGARWKHGNVWSRSVLIEALPFYDFFREIKFDLSPLKEYN